MNNRTSLIASTIMPQILDPLPNGQRKEFLCCYVNATSQIQVVRITNIPNWYFERVAFPGQRLVFEALPDALLEVHTGMMASAILSDTIPCERLCIDDGDKEPVKGELITATLPTAHKPVITISETSTHHKISSLKPAALV